MDIDKLRAIYDEVYSRRGNYNRPDYLKFSLDFANKVGGKILDVGCGKGHHLRMLVKNGVDAFGIEISQVCCKNFLTDVPHECTDIISYSKKEITFNGVICIGVMEHIPYEDVDNTLAAISKLAKTAIFAIANHSDILCGHELHIIQENKEWWTTKLIKYYESCIITHEFRKLFIIECARNHSL